jgi:hypothetical protein
MGRGLHCNEGSASAGRQTRARPWACGVLNVDIRTPHLPPTLLGLKRFRSASITIAGIELMRRIRKGQFKLGKLRIKGKTAPEVWNAVLSA